MSDNSGAHLAITAALHDTLSVITDAFKVPMPELGDEIVDDVLLAYDHCTKEKP